MAVTHEEQATAIAEASSGVKTLSDKFEKLSERFSNVNWLLSVLVVALFIGFAATFVASATLIYDAWTNKAATYLELQKEVQAQNTKIDALTGELQRNKQPTSTPLTNK